MSNYQWPANREEFEEKFEEFLNSRVETVKAQRKQRGLQRRAHREFLSRIDTAYAHGNPIRKVTPHLRLPFLFCPKCGYMSLYSCWSKVHAHLIYICKPCDYAFYVIEEGSWDLSKEVKNG